MTQRLSVNTCDCVIDSEQSNSEIAVNVVERCNLHKDIRQKQALYNVVLAHHRTFSNRPSSTPMTESEERDLIRDMRIEKLRIRNLP